MLKRLRIIWLCNRPLSPTDTGASGTWLDAMAHGLVSSGSVEIFAISKGLQPAPIRQSYGNITQLILPYWASPIWHGLPMKRYLFMLTNAITEYSPDILHIWGTEYYWGLLTARKLVTAPSLVTVQGFKYITGRSFSGELTAWEQLQCAGIKEWLTGRTTFQTARKYRAWRRYEEEILRGHHYFSYHSSWQQAVITAKNRTAETIPCALPLREAFYSAEAWRTTNCDRLPPRLLCSAASMSSLKGLHVAIRAMAILKDEFPGIQLRVIGKKPYSRWYSNGYRKWITILMKRYGLEHQCAWLGTMTAPELIKELQDASVFVMPSFLESYSMTIAEAQMIGTPVVASFVGGTPSLIHHNDTGCFFPAGDVYACVAQIRRILTNQDFAASISTRARKQAMRRHELDSIIQTQLSLYQRIISGI